MNMETPHITLAHDNPNGGPEEVFWISSQEGMWDEDFEHGGITIRPPFRCPAWNSVSLMLHPRGYETTDNKRLMVATREDFERIVEAVKAFNAHHKEIAKEKEPRVEKKSETETPHAEIKFQPIEGTDYSAARITSIRGTWTEPFHSGAWTLHAPKYASLVFDENEVCLPMNYTVDQRPTIAHRNKISGIHALFAVFNTYYAEARKREEAEQAAKEAEKPKVRKSLAVLELGSETTDELCYNCVGHDSVCPLDAQAFPHDTRTHRPGADSFARLTKCLAAEARYNDMRDALELNE